MPDLADPLTWTPEYSWKLIDHVLLNAKLAEIAEEMHPKLAEDKAVAHFEARKRGNAAYYPSERIRQEERRADEWAEKTLQVSLQVWGIQGYKPCRAFYRAVYENLLSPLFAIRKSTVAAGMTLDDQRTRCSGRSTAALGAFARAMSRLTSRWARKMDIAARETEYAEQQAQKAASKTGFLEVNGRQCLPQLWERFNSQKTTSTAKFRDLILNNVASLSIPAPCTHRDVVEQIANQSKIPIPIESLSDDLNLSTGPRGQSVFGFPGDYFDSIAQNYNSMQWWISDKGLNMAVVGPAKFAPNISPFDALAGKLMAEARSLRAMNGRLSDPEYEKITAEIDTAGHKPVDHLEEKCRAELASWNQKHPQQAIHQFSKALKNHQFCRGVKKRLSRAEENWSRGHR